MDLGVSRVALSACPIAFGEVSIKTRIKSVIKYKKASKLLVFASLAICIGVSLCFMTEPEAPLKEALKEDIEVVEEFYEMFQDRYTPKEKFYHALGMLNEDDKLVFEGIKRIINDTTDHGNGYFAGRMFMEGLSKFKTVRNKDEKGRLVSPKVYKK